MFHQFFQKFSFLSGPSLGLSQLHLTCYKRINLTCTKLTSADLSCPNLISPILTCPELTCSELTEHLSDTSQTPARYCLDTHQTPSTNYPDTIHTPSKHFLYTTLASSRQFPDTSQQTLNPGCRGSLHCSPLDDVLDPVYRPVIVPVTRLAPRPSPLSLLKTPLAPRPR